MPLPLEIYGNYQLLEKLAVGGMAQLYLAKRLKPKGQERTVVLKRILPHLAEDTAFVTMFLDEARIAARLHHQNVIEILDLGAEGDSYFIAMEYIHGEDLRRIAKRGIELGRRMPPPLVCRVIAQACRGLDYAHRRTDAAGKPLRIVHRDVSPQNILVGFDGHVKVVDFGIAKAVDKATVTASGVIKGKHAYMSPEQALGREIDHRTDVFALGIVLYEALTATRLFRRATDLQTLKAVSECRVDPPSRVFPGVPTQLDPIIMRALSKDLGVRYQRADELATALEGWLGDRPDGSVDALSRYVSELFADRLERERSEGKFVPTRSSIDINAASRGGSSGQERLGKNDPTASLRLAEKRGGTDVNEAYFPPGGSPLESRTTDITPAFVPPERITDSIPAAGRRPTAEALPIIDPEAELEPVTISGISGGTTPYGRPLATPITGPVLNPLEQKTLIELSKAFVEPAARVATPMPSPRPPEPEPDQPITLASGRVVADTRPQTSTLRAAPRPSMWPWWLAAGLTTFAVAAVVTKVLVDRQELLKPSTSPAPAAATVAPDAGPVAGAGAPVVEAPVVEAKPAPAAEASADASVPLADAAAAAPSKPAMKPFNLVPVTGATFALVRKGEQLFTSLSGADVAVGTALRVVGPPRGGSKDRDFYGVASVVELKGGEARILFEEPEMLPDGLFVTADEEKEKGPYAKSPAGTHGLTLVGSLQQRAGEPTADVALKNATDFDWSHCEVRLPDNRTLKLGGSVVVKAGATQWISGSAFKPRSAAADAKQRDGFGYVRCSEGDGYLKAAMLP